MILQIETTTKCQCRCIFCLKHIEPSVDGGHIIDDDIFKAVIRSAKELNIGGVALTGFGEPLLDPRLCERIAYIRKVFPDIGISLFTNGILADAVTMTALVKAGLTVAYFSMNAATEAMYNQIMGTKGQFHKVKKNAQDAMNVPGLSVMISAVMNPQFIDPDEADRLRMDWPPENLFLHAAGNWMGRLFPLNYRPVSANCRWYNFQIYVNYRGDICLCCLDPDGRYKFGNIKDISLREAWWGEKRQGFLNKIKNGGRCNVKPCKNCTTT